MKLRIEKAIYGGDGLARDSGKTVFVPGTLPGELVEATIAADRRSFATSELNAILEPSPERVVPGCEYVPRCGGCQYQHASPAFQLQMKLDILKETLARAHLPVPSEIASLAGPAWGYRNRIRLHVMKARAWLSPARIAQAAAGNSLPDRCSPAGTGYRRGRAHCRTLESLCEEVEFFTNGEQDQLLVSLWPGPRQRLTRTRPWKHSPSNCGWRSRHSRALGSFRSKPMMHWGQRSLTYTVSGIPYQVSLGSFFQVNRFLLPELLQLAVKDRSGTAGLGSLLRRRAVRTSAGL